MADKSVFLFLMSIICFWFVLDEFVGRHMITNFITAMIPQAED